MNQTDFKYVGCATAKGLWPFVPSAVGDYSGVRYAAERSPKERLSAWFCSAFLSLPWTALGEYFALGTKSTSGATIIIAMLHSDVMRTATASARQWIPIRRGHSGAGATLGSAGSDSHPKIVLFFVLGAAAAALSNRIATTDFGVAALLAGYVVARELLHVWTLGMMSQR